MFNLQSSNLCFAYGPEQKSSVALSKTAQNITGSIYQASEMSMQVIRLLHFHFHKCKSVLYMSSSVENFLLWIWEQPLRRRCKGLILLQQPTMAKKLPLKTLQIIDTESSIIGKPQAHLVDVCSSATAFLIACFGMKYTANQWQSAASKYGRKKAAIGISIKPCCLPPLPKAAKRMHCQVITYYQLADSHVQHAICTQPKRPWMKKKMALHWSSHQRQRWILTSEKLFVVVASCKRANCKCNFIGFTFFVVMVLRSDDKAQIDSQCNHRTRYSYRYSCIVEL